MKEDDRVKFVVMIGLLLIAYALLYYFSGFRLFSFLAVSDLGAVVPAPPAWAEAWTSLFSGVGGFVIVIKQLSS